MSYKARMFRFTRTLSVMDLRTDAATQSLDSIRRKASRYALLNRTTGTRATFA